MAAKIQTGGAETGAKRRRMGKQCGEKGLPEGSDAEKGLDRSRTLGLGGDSSKGVGRCSKTARSWQCALDALPGRKQCSKHFLAGRLVSARKNGVRSRKQVRSSSAKTSGGVSVTGSGDGVAARKAGGIHKGSKQVGEGAVRTKDAAMKNQGGKPRRQKGGRLKKGGQEKQRGCPTEVPTHMIERGQDVLVSIGTQVNAGDRNGPAVVDLGSEDESDVKQERGLEEGPSRAPRRSMRLARHQEERPSVRVLLGLRPRGGANKKQNAGCGPVEAPKRGGAARLQVASIGVMKVRCKVKAVILAPLRSDGFTLPRIDFVFGSWCGVDGERSPKDMQVKRMRLDGSFLDDLLGRIGGAAAFMTCEWGGMLKQRWDAKKEEALLEMAGSQIGQGSHDRIQVAEGPFSWHSHAILGDSWPNLPSTADLLGVIRDSNLRPGGRGHVHLVVTPIGTWLLHATDKLVQVMYDGSTRGQAEIQLGLQLQQIFDAHKCSVGYLPGVVPTEAPDFWMAVDEHGRAIRDALRKGVVAAQVTAYAGQLKAAGFVIGFAGHSASNACFPLHCNP